MKIKSLILLTFLLAFDSCSMFDRNEFITTESITRIDNQEFIYSVYQIDLDGYRVEFKTVVDKDTTHLFDYGIADAVYSKEHTFKFKVSNDTLFVLNPQQTKKHYYKTKKGTTIQLSPMYADT
jgi:hypothetical protein